MASERVSAATAPFEALYVTWNSSPARLAVDAVLTIALPGAITAAASRDMTNVPRTLTASVRSRCATGVSRSSS